MNQIQFDETDDASIDRAHLRFHLDEDRTHTWLESLRMIMSWKDVFRAFILTQHGPDGDLARLIMCAPA